MYVLYKIINMYYIKYIFELDLHTKSKLTE